MEDCTARFLDYLGRKISLNVRMNNVNGSLFLIPADQCAPRLQHFNSVRFNEAFSVGRTERRLAIPAQQF